MKPKISNVSDELRPEYNFDYSKGVRGEIAAKVKEIKRAEKALNKQVVDSCLKKFSLELFIGLSLSKGWRELDCIEQGV